MSGIFGLFRSKPPSIQPEVKPPEAPPRPDDCDLELSDGSHYCAGGNEVPDTYTTPDHPEPMRPYTAEELAEHHGIDEEGAHAPPETLTVRIHQDKRGNWRISVVDTEGKTLLVRAGFGFADWYEARRYADRIASARLEIATERD